MPKYAVEINDETVDMIQALNGGVRPEIKDWKKWFLFTVTLPDTIENPEILTEDALYKKRDREAGKPIATWIKMLIG